MKKNRWIAWITAGAMCLSALVTPYPVKTADAMTILETNVSTASDGCTMLGVYGSYYSQAQEALDRINEIRKEACEEGVQDPRNSSRKLTPSDYVPIKWSTDLESVARIRAVEGGLAYSFMGSGHNRLNGKEIRTVSYNGVSFGAENLAYNWGNSMVSGIEQWYKEKADWVNQKDGEVTGHYTSMIDPSHTYVGLGDFYTKAAKYSNTLAGNFSTTSENLDQTIMQSAPADVMQKIEVKNSYIKDYILEGATTIDTDQSTTLTPKVNLVNGSASLKLWLLEPVTFTSSDASVATVNSAGVVTGHRSGEVTITAYLDGSELASTTVTVKCAHNYVYGDADSEGYRTGTCSVCGDTIKFIPPTEYTLYWKNGTSAAGSYSSIVPGSIAIGSYIYCLIKNINGDTGYQDMVIESGDESVLSVPKKVTSTLDIVYQLSVLAPGTTTITVYPKYNPALKKTVTVRIDNQGSSTPTPAKTPGVTGTTAPTPTPTKTPAATGMTTPTPTPTKTPAATGMTTPTKTPAATGMTTPTPTPTKTPAATGTTTPATTPGIEILGTPTPSPAKTPEIEILGTPTPVPTKTPDMTGTPEATEAPTRKPSQEPGGESPTPVSSQAPGGESPIPVSSKAPGTETPIPDILKLEKGTVHVSGSYQYKITGDSAVSVVGFSGNSVTKIKVPNTVQIAGKTFMVTAIANNAFKGNTKIVNVTIGDNVKTIGASAFEGCTKMTKVTLGKGITKIGSSAFKNCRKLKNMVVKSAKLKSVGKNSLKGIKSALKIKVPAKKLSKYKKFFKNKGQGKKLKIVK